MSVAVVPASPASAPAPSAAADSALAAAGNIKLFTQLAFADDFTIKPPIANKSGGRAVYVEGDSFILGEDLEAPFIIKPGFGKDTPEVVEKMPFYEKLPLVVNVTPEIKAKSEELQLFMLERAVAAHTTADPKDAWLPEMRDVLLKAKPEHRTIMFTTKVKSLVREGKLNSDGDHYEDSATVKITGWRPYLEGVVMTEKKKKDGSDGETKMVLSECVWRDRLVEEGPIPFNTTQFFLWVPMAGRWTDKLPVCNDAGEPVNFGTPEAPKYRMRYVSPRDMKAHSRVTPIVRFQSVYAVADCGPQVFVQKLLIKPPPPRVETDIPGLDVAANLPMDALLNAMSFAAGGAGAGAVAGAGAGARLTTTGAAAAAAPDATVLHSVAASAQSTGAGAGSSAGSGAGSGASDGGILVAERLGLKRSMDGAETLGAEGAGDAPKRERRKQHARRDEAADDF